MTPESPPAYALFLIPQAQSGQKNVPGTLCGRIRDFTELFGPLSREILAHQNQAAIQQGDETRWRVQEQKGSPRAWLWLAISAEAAMVLFGGAKKGTIVVCDRFSTYKRRLGSNAI